MCGLNSDVLQSVDPLSQQKAAMFSERGSGSNRLMFMEVLHSTARPDAEENTEDKNRWKVLFTS